MTIQVDEMLQEDLNQAIRDGLRAGKQSIVLQNVNGQRYIGDGLAEGHMDIYGTPGNDLAAFMDGMTITVYGNAQDAAGNTMNHGRIVVHGCAGDTVGYSMRGGEIFIREGAGHRVGIHMKAYRDHQPTVVIGGCVGDFCGEYMAGGILIVMGLHGTAEAVGNYCATGMHGGEIFLRGDIAPQKISPQAQCEPLSDADRAVLEKNVKQYCAYFGASFEQIMQAEWRKVTPKGHNPYLGYYVNNSY